MGRDREMVSTFVILSFAAFIALVSAGVFAVLIVSIRRGQRAPFLTNTAERHGGAIARRALVGIRNSEEER